MNSDGTVAMISGQGGDLGRRRVAPDTGLVEGRCQGIFDNCLESKGSSDEGLDLGTAHVSQLLPLRAFRVPLGTELV